MPVTPGRTYTISAYARGTLKAGYRIQMAFRDSTGAYISTSTPTNIVNPSGWVRVSSTVTAPQNAAYMEGILYVGPSVLPQPGDTLDATGLLIEERPAPALPYFDGSSNDNTGIVYSWEGATDASVSNTKTSVTEVRRNICTNPTGNPGGSSTALGGGNSGGSIAMTATGGRIRPQTWSYTAGTTAGGDKGPQIRLNGLLTVGTTYTVSCYVKVTSLFTPEGMRIGFYDGSTWLGSSAYSTTLNAWTRLSFTFVATTTGGVAVVGAPQRSGITGVDFVLTDVLVEASSIVGDYFDGDTTPDADLTASWTGTKDNSASILSGVSIANTNGGFNNRSIVYRTWINGSVAIVPKSPTDGTSGATYASIPFNAIPGQTYTALATLTVSSSLTLGTDTNHRERIFVTNSTPFRGAGNALSPVSPNTPGTYSHRVMFTASGNTLDIRLGSGAAPDGGIVTWDNLCITAGVYTGPYLDGNTLNSKWRGTPHNSTSLGYPSNV